MKVIFVTPSSFSVGANDTHGLARTNDDKRNVVTRILQGEEWAAKFSDRNVAEIRKVSHTMVSNIKKELSRLNPAYELKNRKDFSEVYGLPWDYRGPF